MNPIIYDVAVSIDGYIAGPDSDISAFASGGPVVEEYQDRLQTYSCVIMGRATYEFGYRFGLTAGANPYPHMDCFVFSRTLELAEGSDVQVIRDDAKSVVSDLKAKSTGPIYLCGGGDFAGSLLASGLIDVLRLKRAPAILGSGVPLFGNSGQPGELKCANTKLYDDGYLFQDFELLRAGK